MDAIAHHENDKPASSTRNGVLRSRILVVDDVPANRKLVKKWMKGEGYEALEAEDGVAALEVVRSHLPDLILLDIQMPGMNGYEVCERLKTDEATRAIPVIFMSAQGDTEAQTRGFMVGAEDFVTKPIHAAVLNARVRAHLALYARQRSLEGMFRDALEFAPDAIVLADLQGQIVRANARAAELFGYPRGELIGLAIEALMPSEQRASHHDRRAAYDWKTHRLRTGVAGRCLRKDGSEFAGDISLSSLQTDHGQLLMTVVRDVTDNLRAQQEIRESRQQLRELAARGEAMREYERKRIAREVHDELGQVLTALRMDLTFLDMRHGAQVPELQAKLHEMRGLVDRAIHGVRNVAANLRPTVLDMGLLPAVEWLCGEFRRNTGIACTLDAGQGSVELLEDRAIGLFRIVQESLTNITRYAQAHHVQVSLRWHQDASQLVLEVSDDGCGFDPGSSVRPNSFGLLGMRERAIALGGTLHLDSAPGQGTRIRVAVPVYGVSQWQGLA